MTKFIGRWFQQRREKRLKQIDPSYQKHLEWLQYMRRKRVIMPAADPRNLQQMHKRIIAHG